MESAHDELDPCQRQQAVNSLLFSLWWCTMQPAIVVKFFGRENLLYSWFCHYFYPLRKIERCRLLDGYMMVTWEDKFTHPNKKTCNADEQNLFNITDLFIPLLIISFSLVTLYVWLSRDVMRRNVIILVTQHFYSFSHRKEETDCFGRKQQVRKKKYM